MTTEEKAKRYDEAIERANELNYVSDKDSLQCKTVEHIFPELKEDKGENIREEIITYLSTVEDKELIPYESWIAWLEKQGEQKLVGKTETKFKEGDWIVYSDAVWQVCNTALQNYYELLKTNNEVAIRIVKEVDENAHLWTIADAKDGDVLVSPATQEGDKECPFIFKEIDKNGIVRYHVALLQSETIKIADGITNVMGYANAGYHTPATKEQRDTFFAKMKEAGYEWNDEQKHLIMLNHFVDYNDMVEAKFNVGDWIVCCDYEPVQIIGIRMNTYYEMSNGDSRPIYMVDNNPNERLWTIQDAKEGDAIYAESRDNTLDFICIFSKLENEKTWVYCSVDSDSDYLGNDLKHWHFDDCNGFINLYNYDFYPATKAQRDILFQKMKEEGYDWVLKPKVEIKRRNDDDKI